MTCTGGYKRRNRRAADLGRGSGNFGDKAAAHAAGSPAVERRRSAPAIYPRGRAGLRGSNPGYPRALQFGRRIRALRERYPGRLRHRRMVCRRAMVKRPRRNVWHLVRRRDPVARRNRRATASVCDSPRNDGSRLSQRDRHHEGKRVCSEFSFCPARAASVALCLRTPARAGNQGRRSRCGRKPGCLFESPPYRGSV